jgi:hypothetical protein
MALAKVTSRTVRSTTIPTVGFDLSNPSWIGAGVMHHVPAEYDSSGAPLISAAANISCHFACNFLRPNQPQKLQATTKPPMRSVLVFRSFHACCHSQTSRCCCRSWRERSTLWRRCTPPLRPRRWVCNRQAEITVAPKRPIANTDKCHEMHSHSDVAS